MEERDLRMTIRAFLHSVESKLSPIRTYFAYLDAPHVTEADRDALLKAATDNLERIHEEIIAVSIAIKADEKTQSV